MQDLTLFPDGINEIVKHMNYINVPGDEEATLQARFNTFIGFVICCVVED